MNAHRASVSIPAELYEAFRPFREKGWKLSSLTQKAIKELISGDNTDKRTPLSEYRMSELTQEIDTRARRIDGN